jgi:hypothetical protein
VIYPSPLPNRFLWAVQSLPGRIALPCRCRNILPWGRGAMPAETVERKLASILAADIAGHLRLTGADEVLISAAEVIE